MEILTKENLVETPPVAISRTFTPFVIHDLKGFGPDVNRILNGFHGIWQRALPY